MPVVSSRSAILLDPALCTVRLERGRAGDRFCPCRTAHFLDGKIFPHQHASDYLVDLIAVQRPALD